MAALRFRSVGCVRGWRQVFEGVSFALGPGDAAVVTGANGAGKSSLLRIAAGLLKPVAGGVEREGRTALMSEAAALDPELPLARALQFWAAIDGRADAVDAALDAVGLTSLAAVPVRLLSTGQRRRAALARVVAADADLWLLDEPANGLDAASVAMLEMLVARHRTDGRVAVVATHLPLAIPDAVAVAL